MTPRGLRFRDGWLSGYQSFCGFLRVYGSIFVYVLFGALFRCFVEVLLNIFLVIWFVFRGRMVADHQNCGASASLPAGDRLEALHSGLGKPHRPLGR